MVGEKKIKRLFQGTGKLFSIHVSVSVNKVLLAQGHAHLFTAAFLLQWQRWVAATQTVRAVKPETFPIQLFTE